MRYYQLFIPDSTRFVLIISLKQDPPEGDDDLFLLIDWKAIESLPEFLTKEFGPYLTRVTDTARCRPGTYRIKGYDEPWEGYRYFGKVQQGKPSTVLSLKQ